MVHSTTHLPYYFFTPFAHLSGKRRPKHCPNLVPDSEDRAKYGPALQASGGLFNVTVNFDKNQRIHWDSLIHLYTGTTTGQQSSVIGLFYSNVSGVSCWQNSSLMFTLTFS